MKELMVKYAVDLESAENGKLVYVASFYGDTYNRKEDLKAYGCKWDASTEKWEKKIEIVFSNDAERSAETKKMRASIKSDLCAKDTGIESKDAIVVALKLIEDYKVATAEIGEKPELPEEFEAIRANRCWNGKLYKNSVYFSGKKVEISDELATLVRQFQTDLAAWEERKKSFSR